jgi:hypothetical protein
LKKVKKKCEKLPITGATDESPSTCVGSQAIYPGITRLPHQSTNVHTNENLTLYLLKMARSVVNATYPTRYTHEIELRNVG